MPLMARVHILRSTPAAEALVGSYERDGEEYLVPVAEVSALLAAITGGAVPEWKARPAPTVGQMVRFAQAAVTGEYVADEVREARQVVCAACDQVRRDEQGLWCGICGCGVSPEMKKIRNLAAYVERLPRWGCKHPARADGRGWPSVG